MGEDGSNRALSSWAPWHPTHVADLFSPFSTIAILWMSFSYIHPAPAFGTPGGRLGMAARTVRPREARGVRQPLRVLVAVGAGKVGVDRRLVRSGVDEKAGSGEWGGAPARFFRTAGLDVRFPLPGRPREDIATAVGGEALGIAFGPGQRGRECQQCRRCRQDACDADSSPEQRGHYGHFLPILRIGLRRVQCRFPWCDQLRILSKV